jgi:hypothetical protein
VGTGRSAGAASRVRRISSRSYCSLTADVPGDLAGRPERRPEEGLRLRRQHGEQRRRCRSTRTIPAICPDTSGRRAGRTAHRSSGRRAGTDGDPRRSQEVVPLRDQRGGGPRLRHRVTAARLRAGQRGAVRVDREHRPGPVVDADAVGRGEALGHRRRLRRRRAPDVAAVAVPGLEHDSRRAAAVALEVELPATYGDLPATSPLAAEGLVAAAVVAPAALAGDEQAPTAATSTAKGHRSTSSGAACRHGAGARPRPVTFVRVIPPRGVRAPRRAPRESARREPVETRAARRSPL